MALEIDGNILEGGGQILRMSVSLATVIRKPVRISNIRAGRRQPGLAAQHLSGVQLVKELSNAQVDGDFIRSTSLQFSPGTIKAGEYSADTKTAGSVALMLQISMPCCLFSDGPLGLTLRGGTNADMAPPIDFSVNVLLPTLKKFGIKCDHKIKRRGFFPAGRGEVHLCVHPMKELLPINITDFGVVEEITGQVYFAGKVSKMVAEKLVVAARSAIMSQIKSKPVNISTLHFSDEEAFGSGLGIILFARTSTGCILASSQIGRVGSAGQEKIATVAAEELLEEIKHAACVDRHMQDQLIIYMALANGVSTIRTGPLTLHTETAIHVVKQMTQAQFHVEKLPNGGSTIECRGIGLRRQSE